MKRYLIFALRHLKILFLFFLVGMGVVTSCCDEHYRLEKEGYFEEKTYPCTVLYATQEGENNDEYYVGLSVRGIYKKIPVEPGTYYKAKNNIGGTMYFNFSEDDLDEGFEKFETLAAISTVFIMILGISSLCFGLDDKDISDKDYSYREIENYTNYTMIILSVIPIFFVLLYWLIELKHF